jgi:hypothetical protein
MSFMGYPLNMPFYFQRNLYKMSKRFKREKADSSLFHHGLIKLVIVYHLSLHGDSWRAIIAHNGFDDTNPVQVDKPMVNETKVELRVPFHVLLPPPKPSTNPDVNLPDTMTEKIETFKIPVGKKAKENPTAYAKGKKNARMISRMARNKPKPSVEKKPIILSEDSDSDIERFLASEYPYSQGLCLEPPYDFVSNLPPCLRNDPSYPGIKLPNETLGNVIKPSPTLSKPGQSSCEQCDLWLERYYIDVPLLQSKIQSLESQVVVLTSQRDQLQATDKKQRTTGSIVFKNVESATAVINSELS